MISRRNVLVVLMAGALLLAACASSGKANYQGYQPKYKKPNPNKPLPCPMKDC